MAQSARTKRVKPGPVPTGESQQLLSMFLEGFLPDEIAAETGRSQASVESAIKVQGYNPERFKFGESIVRRWIKSYLTGDKYGPVSISEIAYEWNTSWGTVAMQMSRRGTKLRHTKQACRLGARRRAAKKKAGVA